MVKVDIEFPENCSDCWIESILDFNEDMSVNLGCPILRIRKGLSQALSPEEGRLKNCPLSECDE